VIYRKETMMREGLANLESKSNELSKKMDELARLERQFREMVNDLKADLMKAVKNVVIPGVDVHEERGCTFAVVSPSAFNWNCWSPHYYIPKEQAKAVISELENVTTVDGICKKVGAMLLTGYVGERSGDRIYLNDYTIRAIKNSDIGVYVMAHGYAKKKPNKYVVTYEDGCRTYEATVYGNTSSDGIAAFAKDYPNARFVSIR
jgi:chaperonin cofactor prefoldin